MPSGIGVAELYLWKIFNTPSFWNTLIGWNYPKNLKKIISSWEKKEKELSSIKMVESCEFVTKFTVAYPEKMENGIKIYKNCLEPR